MNINLEINNKSGCDIKNDEVFLIARETLKESNFGDLGLDMLTISMAFVSGDEIKKINKNYRGKDSVTDVLSFPFCENIGENTEKELFLGEVILCCDYIKKSARMNNMSFEEEVRYIISHGILHLLGFSHGKEMFSIQEKVSKEIIR